MSNRSSTDHIKTSIGFSPIRIKNVYWNFFFLKLTYISFANYCN